MAQKKRTVNKRKKTKKTLQNLQKWLLNFAIACLAIIIVSFMLSSTKRISSNDEKIDLSNQTVVNKMPIYQDITIEVLNGCGIPGMAGRYTNFLREKGFDVIYYGNADEMNHLETFVIAGDTTAKKLTPLLTTMNINRSRIKYLEGMDSFTTFKIILGKDCDDITVYQQIKKMENQF